MNSLEQMGYIVKPIIKIFTPFEKWEGSRLKDWEITLQLLTTGDQIEVARAIAEDAPTVLGYTAKIQSLAKALRAINGEPIITEEQLSVYRTEHKSPDLTSHDYIILYLKKLPEHVVDAMIFSYNQLQDAFAAQLLGKPLPDALTIAKVESHKTQEQELTEDGEKAGISIPTED